MTTSNTQTEQALTFASYTVTVQSHLSPEQLANFFNHLTITDTQISFSNVLGETTNLEVLNVELNNAEFIDESLNE